MNKSFTLADAYKIWWDKIGPKNCHEIQKEEMFRSFYSGASMMFLMMVDATEGSEAEAMKAMSGFRDEIEAFKKRMQEIKA